MRITEIRVDRAMQCLWGNFDRQFKLRFINPMNAIHPSLGFKDWFWDLAICIVRVKTEDGHEGIGWCEDGAGAAEAIIRNHLHRLVVDQDVFDYEGIWDRMYRASIPYGRKGAALEAIAAIDIAIWDAMGKITDKSLAQLLGGGAVKTTPAYASGLHHTEPELAQQEAADYVAKGYQAMKARLGYGPLEGVAGMVKNEAHIRAIREAAGDGVAIMADAYMGWTLPYAIEMCGRLEKYHLSWIEEPFIPDDIRSYRELRQATSIPVAGGEHEFTRFGFEQILAAGAMDILQPDLHRCGGITEGRKIAALAAAHGKSIYPHAFTNVHAHFVAATVNAPSCEFFPVPCWEDQTLESKASIILNQAEVSGGIVKIPTTPGHGVAINESLLKETKI